MQLPNGHRAIVTEAKLLDYLLNEDHPDQPGRAELFRRLLGITPATFERLRAALLAAAATGDASPGKPSPSGTKYEVRFDMAGPRGSRTILSVWMIERGQPDPRLVTAFIE